MRFRTLLPALAIGGALLFAPLEPAVARTPRHATKARKAKIKKAKVKRRKVKKTKRRAPRRR
jgi:hypothetical protein